MRDEIIKMAREAGFYDGEIGRAEDAFERFFHMAQAHALSNIDPSKFMSYQEGVEAGRLAEREACAKVCEDSVEYAGDTLAQAIRARGQA